MATTLAWIGTAHIHTPGFSNEVVKRGVGCAGVWDHDLERAEKNAEKLGGPVREIMDLAKDKGVEGFVICSETVRHLDLVRLLAPSGKPIFIEKPIGVSAEQSRQICSLLEGEKIVFQTGYFNRGKGAYRAIKKMVVDGVLGQITRVRASTCHDGALGGWFDSDWRWMADRSQAGVGAFGDLGTHSLDLLMWIFGPVAAATGCLTRGTERYEGCDEAGEGLLLFKNGFIGTLAASWDDVADPMRFQVWGTRGYACLGEELMLAGPDHKLVSHPMGEDVPSGFPAFLDCLEGKNVDLVTPREAANRDIVMDAIYRGAQTRQWVEIDV